MGTGASSCAKRPRCWAAAAFCCEAWANLSWSSRLMWYWSTRFSAVSPMASVPYWACISGLIKRQPKLESCICESVPKAFEGLDMTNGARVIFSTPPATNKSPSPLWMARAAAIPADKPLAQSRFTVSPGTLWGKPASSAAMRATLRLSSPAWLAQPKITSATAARSALGLRLSSSRMVWAARSSGRTAASVPPKLPMGVRTPSMI
jgi:hypothetical protein